MATVRIPTPLRTYTQNKDEVSATGATVGEVLRNLEKSFPGIGARLMDDKGALRRYVNVFHNDEDIRFLKQLETPVADADKISIIPAIAGGH
jgi:sulfur-carrier protein